MNTTEIIKWLSDFWENFSSEILGIAGAALIVLILIVRLSRKKRKKKEPKIKKISGHDPDYWTEEKLKSYFERKRSNGNRRFNEKLLGVKWDLKEKRYKKAY